MKYLEECLNMAVKRVIPIIQRRLLDKSTYFGIKAVKSPTDAWVYQEIIWETKPDIIIEIGTYCGGGTLYLAHLCDLLGKGKVIGVDNNPKNFHRRVRNHPRITFIRGDACKSFPKAKKLISESDRVLVIEDSLHTFKNTLNVLRTYSPLIKSGDYFIVEDTNCYHGLACGPRPGPWEAVEAFLRENKDFEIDRTREFIITWNPKGYLKRK